MEMASAKAKLEKILSFCQSRGYDVEDLIIDIINKLNRLPRELLRSIDGLWNSVKGLERGVDISIIVIKLLGCMWSLLGLTLPLVDIPLKVVLLVAYFLKMLCRMYDWKKTKIPEGTIHDANQHEQAGLEEMFGSAETLIDSFTDRKTPNKSSLDILSKNIDIHIGVYELGRLKSRIKCLMLGGKDDWLTALQLLKLFVRISTFRHSLLFRYQTCLKTNKRFLDTISALKAYIEKERRDNISFLSSIFLVPTLKDVGILTIFDPFEEKELNAYLEELNLSIKDLRSILHNGGFMISPVRNPSIQLARLVLFWSYLGAMKCTPFHIRALLIFQAIENTLNLFRIVSQDSGKFLYMNDNGYCKYASMSSIPENAQWRVILVDETDGTLNTSSYFILCNKKWPEKPLYVERSILKCAKGLDTDSIPKEECLFTLTKPYHSPISVTVQHPGNLKEEPTSTKDRQRSFRKTSIFRKKGFKAFSFKEKTSEFRMKFSK